MTEIEHWDVTRDGPLSEQALWRKLESRGFSVTRYVYHPAIRFPPHTHDCDKLDAVLSGRLCLVVDNIPLFLEAGDCLYIPKGVLHSAEVSGQNEVISLDGTRA